VKWWQRILLGLLVVLLVGWLVSRRREPVAAEVPAGRAPERTDSALGMLDVNESVSALRTEAEPAADETPTGRIPVQSADGPVPAPADISDESDVDGSARSLPDGSPPSDEFTIKGNKGSMLYHTADSPYYGRTKAEVWFKTPQDAERAGFTAWNRRRRGNGKPAAAAGTDSED
jgi:hypothetical protein